MRRLAAGLLTFGVVGALLVASPAVAASCGAGTSPMPIEGGTICIPANDPGSGGSAGGGTEGAGTGGGKQSNCTSGLSDPQPPASASIWGGKTPEDGAIFWEMCENGHLIPMFVPKGEEPPPVDPRVLAQNALGSLKLATPEIHLAPGAPSMTYVGLATWLWMPEGQWSTLTKSVTAGATTVTVTAEPRTALWNMGAGSTTCHTPGREWIPKQMAKDATTSCQYTYKHVSDFQPHKKFPVSATITYRVDWTCSGNCGASEGTLGNVDGMPGSSSVRVGERQSVNITPQGQ